jgi:glycosyltransferase involved in cell wall biosynthesis
MANTWLSVLMPVHNGAEYVRSALDSIVAQGNSELASIEVIAVDDGSTDQTPEILDTYRKRLNLITQRNEPNAGWTTATNQAMQLACGTYQCWLHQDDTWQPERLSRLRDYVSRWPQAVLILHPSWFIDPHGRQVGMWRCPLTPNRSLEPALVVARLLVQNFTAAPAPLYRSDVIPLVGQLDERLWYTADWDFWLRVAETGTTVYCPEPLSCFRIHPDSQTCRRTANSEELWYQFHQILDRYLADAMKNQSGWSEVAGTAWFSALVNIQLAHWAAGGHPAIGRLALEFGRLGPRGWRRYLRDSRICERVLSRLRARLLSRGNVGRAGCLPDSAGCHGAPREITAT